MADETKKRIQYTFNGQNLNFTHTFNPSKLNYSISGAAQATPQELRPVIGPEIGPDPRNASARINLPDYPAILDEKTGIRFDFHHGYRIKMPDTPGSYHLSVYDMDAEIMLGDYQLQPGQTAVGNFKYYIRYRLSVELDKKLIFLHDYDCTGKKVMVVVPDGGLGDNLAWMPYAEAFRVEHHAKVTCVCGEWLIRLVKDQYPELDFIPVSTQPSSLDYYACYFCAIFPKERKTWRPSDHQNFGMQGSVAKLLGVEPVNRKVRLKLNAPRPFPEPFVCISTMATNPAKYWNCPDGWNCLCRYLKRLGYRVLVIDRDPHLVFAGKHYYVPEEAEDWTGLKPISERIDLLQHAAFFIGLPSGLSWLAWNCNIPVVMLSGFTLDGSEFPTPYRVTNFNFCHGCWNDSNLFFDMHVPVWCPRHVGTPREIECTRAITPKMVIGTVNRIPDAAKRFAEKKAQQPRVSFIITSCHGEYLTETLASIERLIMKSGVASEIILYDDASNGDKARIRFDRLQAIYPDILQIYHGTESIGAAFGRNEAISHARADYLLIFDDDDLILPFHLKEALDFMDAHPEIPVSYAQKYLFSKEKGFIKEIHGAPHSLIEAFFSPKININASIIRKKALLKEGGFHPVDGDKTIHGEDVDLLIRLGISGDLYFDHEPRCLYRIHQNQLTAQKQKWADSITGGPGKKNPELYERILKGDIPDVHGPDFRLVRGLMGAALYFNQHNRKITDPIVKTALKEFPDDFGSWDLYFMTLVQDGKIKELLEEYPKAMERFKDEPAACYNLLAPLVLYCRTVKKNPPEEIRPLLQEISNRYLKLPQLVAEEFKKLGISV